MFNDRYGLTRAVIEGRKTMTRRVCKDYATGKIILGDLVESWRYYPDEGLAEFVMKDGSVMVAKTPYREGEVVAVAQNYNDALDEYNRMGDTVGWGALVGTTENGCAGYGNKMFVKAEVMPHKIGITGMKIERINSISEEDCLREGITKGKVTGMYTFENAGDLWGNPKIAFNHLFVDVSYSKRMALEALKRNAVAWAYEFGIKTGE